MSRIPPLPVRYAQMPCIVADPASPYCAESVTLTAVDVFTADQLRARDRQIVEACIAEAERQRGALTAGGAYANGMRSAYEHMAHRLRSLLGEGEGKHG